jgi:para-nitrobenzyl esterase
MPRTLSFSLFQALLLVLTACSDGSDSSPDPGPVPLGTEVTVSAGPLVGRDSERADTWEWLGIPFAAPPVDDLRWKAPRPATAWSEPRPAHGFAPPCPQYDFFDRYIGEEDCLYLNVWRPRSQARDLPVFLWIHGGSNRWGAADWPVFDGARLAEQADIVVVTIQYRLGALGWLYYPPLQVGDASDDSGNFGTLDIIASLQWVQDNIESFGGDPDLVTAAGESAGGANVLTLMLSERARGLFHQAVVQSAGGSINSTADAIAGSEQLLENLMAAEGMPPGAQPAGGAGAYLRGKSAREIVDANPGVPHVLADGHVIPEAGFDLFDSGDFPGKVPLLIGTNKDEYKLYTNPVGYNALPDASPELRDAVGRYLSDLWRVEGADSIATRLRALDDFPDIYVYRFNWGSPDEEGNSPLPVPFGPTGGAHHGAELPFMFGNWDTFLIDEYKDLLYNDGNLESRRTMAAVMVDYWGSFIRRGHPNGGSLPAWSPWSNTEGDFKAIVLDVNYTDDQPAIGEDFEAWTVESVFDTVYDEVNEPLLSELLPYLEGAFLE